MPPSFPPPLCVFLFVLFIWTLNVRARVLVQRNADADTSLSAQTAHIIQHYACCACVYVLCSFVWLVDSIYIVCTTNRMAERSTGVWIARENSKKKRIHDAAAIHSTVNITDSMQFGWKFCPSEFIIKICLSEQLDNWTIIFKFMLHFRSSSKKSPRKKKRIV